MCIQIINILVVQCKYKIEATLPKKVDMKGGGVEVSPVGVMLPFLALVTLDYISIILKQHMYNNNNKLCSIHNYNWVRLFASKSFGHFC